jgi:hypothetical protein
MPFIEKTRRRLEKFNLADADEREEYEAVLANPANRIIEKTKVQKTETTTDSTGEGSVSQSTTEPWMIVEYEEVSL